MRLIIFFISIILIMVGCKKKENTLIDPPTSLSFSVERVNSTNDYLSQTKQFSLKEKSEKWSLNTFEELSHLSREIIYDIELLNGETVEFGLDFKKGDSCTDNQAERCPINKEDLILKETNPSDLSSLRGKKWDYKDTQSEIENFYKACALNILINNNVFSTTFLNTEHINSFKFTKAIVNGEEKTYAEFNFEGTAFGWFDPEGEFGAVYKITDGSFKGILE